jgi:predicted nucleotidyltransferase
MEDVTRREPEAINMIPAAISAKFLRALRDIGVVKAELFGSSADGTDNQDSDIDLLVTFDPPVTLFEQLRLANQLRQISGRQVDLTTGIHPAFQPYILPTLVSLPL